VERKEAALDLDRYRQVDHAYAVTIRKSQGATVEHTIMFASVKPDRVGIMDGRATTRTTSPAPAPSLKPTSSLLASEIPTTGPHISYSRHG
jgi:hypothetical protein